MPDLIRWAIRNDLVEMLDIEKLSFPIPWDESDFIACLKQRNCIGLVTERNDKVIGYVLYEMLKHSLHVLNFAVHPDYRGQYVGSAMVEKLVHKLSQQRRRELVVEVRESNLPAQCFFRELGFRAVKVLRDYYIEEYGGGDAYQMRYTLGQDAPQTFAAVNRITAFLTTEDV